MRAGDQKGQGCKPPASTSPTMWGRIWVQTSSRSSVPAPRAAPHRASTRATDATGGSTGAAASGGPDSGSAGSQ